MWNKFLFLLYLGAWDSCFLNYRKDTNLHKNRGPFATRNYIVDILMNLQKITSNACNTRKYKKNMENNKTI